MHPIRNPSGDILYYIVLILSDINGGIRIDPHRMEHLKEWVIERRPLIFIDVKHLYKHFNRSDFI